MLCACLSLHLSCWIRTDIYTICLPTRRGPLEVVGVISSHPHTLPPRVVHSSGSVNNNDERMVRRAGVPHYMHGELSGED